MDVDRVERERRIANYLKPEPEIKSARGASSRYQQHRNESLGVSRALGVCERKYEGVGQAIKFARAISQERIPVPIQYQPRGPCPVALINRAEPSLHMPLQPSLNVVQSHQMPLLSKYQSEGHILPVINSARRYQIPSLMQVPNYNNVHQSNNIHNYNYAQVPNQYWEPKPIFC